MRKRPQQQRSRQMVDTLIEATARTIAHHGLDGTTTPLIAEAAGVSVGSLYQYFEDKDALIAALLDKLAHDVTQLLNRSIHPEAAMALEDMVRLSIRVTLNLMHNNEGLYLEIARNWHRLPVHRVADVLEHSNAVAILLSQRFRKNAYLDMVQSQRGALPALKHVVCFDSDGSKAYNDVVDYVALLSAPIALRRPKPCPPCSNRCSASMA